MVQCFFHLNDFDKNAHFINIIRDRLLQATCLPPTSNLRECASTLFAVRHQFNPLFFSYLIVAHCHSFTYSIQRRNEFFVWQKRDRREQVLERRAKKRESTYRFNTLPNFFFTHLPALSFFSIFIVTARKTTAKFHSPRAWRGTREGVQVRVFDREREKESVKKKTEKKQLVKIDKKRKWVCCTQCDWSSWTNCGLFYLPHWKSMCIMYTVFVWLYIYMYTSWIYYVS